MIKKNIKVFKFGGASLKDANALRNVVQILADYQEEPICIVVSAMGKTTNALEAVAQAHARQDGRATEFLDQVKRFHLEIINELFTQKEDILTDINDTFVEIDWVLDDPPHESYDYMYDQMVSVGELISSKIVSAFLNQEGVKCQWLDARDLIRTDNLYREAWVQWEETIDFVNRNARPAIEQGGFVLTQGFIGSTSENFTTTLGREGSDYTAAILSFCLDAEYMAIWKDVPGVLTADPRKFDNVVKLDRLSYREAIEMTYYGAKVIHPKTIKPLQNKSIPLYVKSFIDPKGSGTYIGAEVEDNYPPMVAVEENQALLNISTRDFSFVAEQHLRFLFKLIAEHRLQVNMMQNTAISFVVCVSDVDDRVDAFAQQIESDFQIVIERGLQLITVRHYENTMLEALKKGKMVLAEERINNTIQTVVKTLPMIKWKEE
ncbi:MAG: aspartate kinase [Bacteroidota bacterium]